MELNDEFMDEDFIFFSLLYSSITVLFAMAVLSKFITNELRFGLRSAISLAILFVGEPLCHFLVKGSAGVVVFGLGCLFIYSILPASHLPAKDKTVFITGCDSGFGFELAKKLDSIGMRIYACCLDKNGAGAIKLTNACSDRMKLIQLDVTDEKQIDEAFDFVSLQVGEEGLWGVVNNAGISYVSEIEMTPEIIFRRVMEVNLFGTVRVTKKFLPLVKKSKGRVVFMSSMAGRVAFDGMGCYSMSKFALEAYADTLRLEMKKWGVSVSTIEPVGFQTGNTCELVRNNRKEEVWRLLDEPTKEAYGKDYYEKLHSQFASFVQRFPTDLTPVTRALRSGLLSKRPQQRYLVGRGVGMFLTIYPLLPVWLGDKLVQSIGSAVVEDLKPAHLRQ